MVELPNGTLLTLEKSTRNDGGSPAYRTEIYQVGFSGATDISQGAPASGLANLHPGSDYHTVAKTLLYSSTSSPIDSNGGENLEGLCLGPQLTDGNWELLGVTDNNGDSNTPSNTHSILN
jgi:hypothetical protein